MWKPLLAATLAAGRNTKLLMVGSNILAINAPIVTQIKGLGVCGKQGCFKPPDLLEKRPREWRSDSHTLTTSSGGFLKFKWLREVCMRTVIRTAAVCVKTGRGLQSHGTLLSHMFGIVEQQQRDKSEAIYGTSQSMEPQSRSQCWVKVLPGIKKFLARHWAYREFFEMYFSYTGQSGRQCVESQTLSFSWVNRSSAVAIETAVSSGLLTLASRKHLYASLQICVWRECGSEGRKMWMVMVRCRLKMFVFETSESCVDPYQMYLLNE